MTLFSALKDLLLFMFVCCIVILPKESGNRLVYSASVLEAIQLNLKITNPQPEAGDQRINILK